MAAMPIWPIRMHYGALCGGGRTAMMVDAANYSINQLNKFINKTPGRFTARGTAQAATADLLGTDYIRGL